MIPEELEKLVVFHKSQGHLPFFVNATTGTTVYGAFDPIPEIADICEKHHIWLHIDVRSNARQSFCVASSAMSSLFLLKAAWGGGLMMSRKYRADKFKGIER